MRTTSEPVNREITTATPASARFQNLLEFDYRCGEKRSSIPAGAEVNAPLATVAAPPDASRQMREPGASNHATLGELAHACIRREPPRITGAALSKMHARTEPSTQAN